MNKVTYTALEKVYAREIRHAILKTPLPLHSKAKIYKKLRDEGLLQEYTQQLGRDRFGAIEVTGWILTDFGRLSFCLECGPEEEQQGNG